MILVVLGVLGAGVFIKGFEVRGAPEEAVSVNILPPKLEDSKNKLQLYTFGYTTITPNKPPDDGAKKPDGALPPGDKKQCEYPKPFKGGICICPPEANWFHAICKEDTNTCLSKKAGSISDPVRGLQGCVYNQNHSGVKEKLADPNCIIECFDVDPATLK